MLEGSFCGFRLVLHNTDLVIESLCLLGLHQTVLACSLQFLGEPVDLLDVAVLLKFGAVHEYIPPPSQPVGLYPVDLALVDGI